MKSSATKDILTGLFLCMLIIAVMYIIPVIGVFIWMLIPLPILFYRLKTGRNGGGIIAAVTLAALIILTGKIANFNTLYFGSLLMTGFFLGEFIERHLSIEKIMIYTTLAVTGVCVAALFLYALTQGRDIEQLLLSYILRYHDLSSQLFSESIRLYPNMKIDRQTFEKATSLFAGAFPGLLVNSYLTMAWLNILLIKKLLKRQGIIVESIEDLSQWKAPDYLVFGLIGLSVVMFLPLGILNIIALNCLIILTFIYFSQGIAVVSFFFQKKKAPLALKFFFYILLGIQPFFMFLVIVFGLFDTWFNFRKLDISA